MKLQVFFILPILLLMIALVHCSLQSAVPSLQKIAIIAAVRWESERGQSPSADCTLISSSKAYDWLCFQYLIDGLLGDQGIRLSAGRLEIIGLSTLKIRVLAFVPSLIRELSIKDCTLTKEMSILFVECISPKLKHVEKLELIRTSFVGCDPHFPAVRQLLLDESLLFVGNLCELHLKNISQEQFVYDMLVENYAQLIALKFEHCTLDFPKEKNAFGWVMKDPAPKDHLFNHLFNMKRLQDLEIQNTRISIYRKEDALSRPYPKSLQGLKVSGIEGFKHTQLFMQKSLQRASNLNSLSVDCALFYPQPPLSLFSQFQSVKSLCLTNFDLGRINFLELSDLLQHLEELKLIDCTANNKKISIDCDHSFPAWSLKRFTISHNGFIISHVLEFVFKVFQLCESTLTHLTLPMSPAKELCLSLWRFTNMIELDLHFESRLAFDRCFEANWPFRVSFPILQKITLRGYVILEKIVDLESVPSLDISRASNFDDGQVLDFLLERGVGMREITVNSLNILVLEAFLKHPTINTLRFRLDGTRGQYRRIPGYKKLRQIFD